MQFDGGLTFTNFVTNTFAIFMFILWFWLLITVIGDLFRRHDVSGFAKVLWVILLVVLPISAYSPICSPRAAAWPSGTRRAPRRRETSCAMS